MDIRTHSLTQQICRFGTLFYSGTVRTFDMCVSGGGGGKGSWVGRGGVQAQR